VLKVHETESKREVIGKKEHVRGAEVLEGTYSQRVSKRGMFLPMYKICYALVFPGGHAALHGT
jgi:hypothetical protein